MELVDEFTHKPSAKHDRITLHNADKLATLYVNSYHQVIRIRFFCHKSNQYDDADQLYSLK
jgi:hypothetical protein